MPFIEALLENAARKPEQVAIADEQGALTYGEIVQNSALFYHCIKAVLAAQSQDQLARINVPNEIGEIPVVMVSFKRAADAATIVAMLACYKTVSSVLDPLWPLDHQVRSIRVSGARIVITDDENLIARLQEQNWTGDILTPASLNAIMRSVEAQEPLEKPGVREGNEPFALIFTSGTTAEPKGFLRTRASWRVNLAVSKKYLYAKNGMRTLAPGPLAYSLTLYALIEVLGSGGSLWMQSKFDPIAAVALLRGKQIQRLVCVPAVLPAITAAIKRSATKDFALQHIISGGAQLSTAVHDKFLQQCPGVTITSYYGAAEIGFIGYSEDPHTAGLRLFSGVEVQIRDEDAKTLPQGSLGTLFVRVASQADKYISTAGDTAVTGADGWSTVKDQGIFSDGKLYLEGRAGEVIVTGGHKVSLLQIDGVLDELREFGVGVAVGLPDKNLGSVIAAVFETKNTIDKALILEKIRERLAPQFVPQRVFVTTDLPRTVGGKVRRQEVREQVLQNQYLRLN